MALPYSTRTLFPSGGGILARFFAFALCLHPLAFQAHLAVEAEAEASSFSGKERVSEATASTASGHDSGRCPVCELLGLLSTSQLESSSDASLFDDLGLRVFSETLPSLEGKFAKAFDSHEILPRAPPA
jgi:hypothetical protein